MLRPFLGRGDFAPGSFGHALVDGLGPADLAVEKVAYSAFYMSRLDWVLRLAGIEALIVAGIVTNGGVESTVRDAHVRDLTTVVLEDGDMGSILEKADLPVRPGGDESSAQKDPRQDSDPRSHDEGRKARLRARWFPRGVRNGSILSHPRLPRAVEPYDDEGFPAFSICAGCRSPQDQGGASDVFDQSTAGLLEDLWRELA